MSCNKQCTTKCSKKAAVEITAEPRILCSPQQKHQCEIPVELDISVLPRCTLVKKPCAQSTHNCQTKCKYSLLVDLDVCPTITCGPKHTCRKEFSFETAVDYKTKCLNPSNSSSSTSDCKPCKGKPAHKYSKSCKCSSCNAWRKAH